MNAKVLILLGLLAFAAVDTRPVDENEESGSSEESSEESYESGEAKYDFNYTVKDDSSEVDFGHQESRDDDNTQGSYYVHLPDGRLQTVKYYVNEDSGYVAEVTYEGEVQYPSSEESSEESDESDESEEEQGPEESE